MRFHITKQDALFEGFHAESFGRCTINAINFEWNPRRTDKSQRKCKHLVLWCFFLGLQDSKAGVMEFWLHSFPVLLIDRNKKYSFAGYITQHELLAMGAFGANFRPFFFFSR